MLGQNDQLDVSLHVVWLTALSHELTCLGSARHNAGNPSLPKSRPCAEEELREERRRTGARPMLCTLLAGLPHVWTLGHHKASAAASPGWALSLMHLDSPAPKASRRGVEASRMRMDRVWAASSSRKAGPAASGLTSTRVHEEACWGSNVPFQRQTRSSFHLVNASGLLANNVKRASAGLLNKLRRGSL